MKYFLANKPFILLNKKKVVSLKRIYEINVFIREQMRIIREAEEFFLSLI